MARVFRELWSHDIAGEFDNIALISQCPDAPYVAFDTEFPGFLRHTPRGASPDLRYEDMKHSVDNLKPIQLGITFCDSLGEPWPLTWQINLCDFDPAADLHGERHLALVRRSGLDLNRNHRDGSPAHLVGTLLREKLLDCSAGRKGWVTFHGLYDFGYLLKIVGITPLPDTLPEFLSVIADLLGPAYDLKHMARFCGDGRLTQEVGLMKMSQILEVEFDGKPHQAGNDSFLTGSVFYKLKYEWNMDEGLFAGILYGLEVRAEDEEDDGGGGGGGPFPVPFYVPSPVYFGCSSALLAFPFCNSNVLIIY